MALERRNGPFRIVRQAKSFAEGDQPATVGDYWKKLALMAPAEVTGFYLTFHPMVVANLQADQIKNDTLAPYWPWICAGLVILVKSLGTMSDGKVRTIQWLPVGFATAAFLLWVLTMGHYIGGLSDLAIVKDSRFVGIFAGLFTFIVPYFYPGASPSSPPLTG